MLREWLGGEAGGEGVGHGGDRSGGKLCLGENQNSTGDS